MQTILLQTLVTIGVKLRPGSCSQANVQTPNITVITLILITLTFAKFQGLTPSWRAMGAIQEVSAARRKAGLPSATHEAFFLSEEYFVKLGAHWHLTVLSLPGMQICEHTPNLKVKQLLNNRNVKNPPIKKTNKIRIFHAQKKRKKKDYLKV